MIEWREIKGFENYLVSNIGEVKNRKTNLVLRQYANPKGYLQVWLRNGLIRKKLFAHRIVAIAFIDNPENKQQINHKDGNKKNNTVDNLEWVTGKENILHKYRVLKALHTGGRKKEWINGNCAKRTLLKKFRTEKQLSQSDIAEKIGVSRVTYAYAEQGKRKGSKAFWERLQTTFNLSNEQLSILQELDY